MPEEIRIARNYFAHGKNEKSHKLEEKFRRLCRSVISKDYPEKAEDWKILADYLKQKILEVLSKINKNDSKINNT